MLTLLPNQNIEVSVRPPLIYLDHCAVRKVSSERVHRDHFLETFTNRGTLLFSLLNVVEMASNTGDSYRQIREFLDLIGPFWLLSVHDAGTVTNAEERGLLAPESLFVPVEIFGILYKNMPQGTLQLGSALEAVQGAEFRERAKEWLGPTELARMLRRIRKRREAGISWAGPPAVKGSPLWIQQSLAELLVKDGKKITENDVVDLMHAAVPLRYAHVVVLDKAWASFAKRLELGRDTLVFSVVEMAAALAALRSVDTSHHRVYRPEVPRILGRR